MTTTYIGFDNGVTGTIGIINHHGSFFREIPIKKGQDYTKKKKNITRIDVIGLSDIFCDYVFGMSETIMTLIERPMVNPKRFISTVSALRAFEATLIFLESHGIAYDFIDSKEWQRVLLPKGCEKEQLKPASVTIGKRLFPHCSELIEKHEDADGLLIAEYCRRKYGLK